MKTITITLDGELEQKLDALSRQGGADTASVILDVLKRSLGDVQVNDFAARTIEEVFAAELPPPYDAMSEEAVMAVVEAEIGAARAGHRSGQQGG